MNNNYEFLLNDITKLKNIGKKTALILRKKNINNVFDLLWRLPQSFTDRTNLVKVKDLHIGKILTLEVIPIKYNFPRIRNLPSKVICQDDTGIIDCVFFNSYEGYIRKILPLNEKVTISGKINYFKGKYQITNPSYISKDKNIISKVHSKYSLTEGITEKKYNFIINQILQNLPNLPEWLEPSIANMFKNISWKEALIKLHNYKNIGNYNSNFYKRLVFDEILSSLLVFSEIKKALKEIDLDLSSKSKMFRILQGDVGSGKTIVALLSALNVVESGYQVAFMAPTEILARQHYNLAKKIIPEIVNFDLITSKTKIDKKKDILLKLKNSKIKILFGTHSLFQKKTIFNRLGYIIIDEQHKFGVKQRKALSDKGGVNCDILLMSATPIPRTLTMTIYGDMDLSIIKEKPMNRKEVLTFSKPDEKIDEVLNFVKKEINSGNQIFWVCPLIEKSKKIDHKSAMSTYSFLNKLFPKKVEIIHSKIDQEKKEYILKNFLYKKFDILVSTTIIEVGIDFPNANVIIIENSNKFGLSQLHQLRGRIGRGSVQGKCILMFKNNLSENAKKRIKILKSSNDGFKISEEDMKLRGFGDILGFKQSGEKKFNLADPILHEDLFKIAEKEVKRIEKTEKNLSKYKTLIKLYDKADIIYDLA